MWRGQWNRSTPQKPELERSGMGFAFMEAFMDEVQVQSAPGKGTSVRMKKYIGVQEG